MTDQNTVPADDKGAEDQNQNPKAQDNGNGADKAEHMIPKARFDQVVNQRKAAETALTEVCDELIEEIPEDMRDIIPDLSPADKIKWIRNAMKKGLFATQKDTNGPDSKRPSGKSPANFENMNPQSIMAMGYGS